MSVGPGRKISIIFQNRESLARVRISIVEAAGTPGVESPGFRLVGEGPPQAMDDVPEPRVISDALLQSMALRKVFFKACVGGILDGDRTSDYVTYPVTTGSWLSGTADNIQQVFDGIYSAAKNFVDAAGSAIVVVGTGTYRFIRYSGPVQAVCQFLESAVFFLEALVEGRIADAVNIMEGVDAQAVAFIMFLVGFLLTRRWMPALRRDDVRPIWVFGLLTLSGAMRLHASQVLPPHHLEFNNFELFQVFNPPVFPALLTAWSWLGVPFGLGMDQGWLRFPNLLAGLWLNICLIRIGRLFNSSWAGFWVAVLVSFLPAFVTIGAVHEHYFAEVVATTWFVERVLHFLARRAPIYPSLVVAAFLAVGVGNLPALVVALGFLVVLVVSFVRGRRLQSLVAAFLFLLMYAPILKLSMAQVFALASASRVQALTKTANVMTERLFGHEMLGMPIGAFLTSEHVFGRMFPTSSPAWLGMWGLLALNLVDMPLSWFLMAAVALVLSASSVIWLDLVNTVSIWPLILLIPFLGAERFRWRLRNGNFSAAIQLLLVSILLVHGYYARSSLWDPVKLGSAQILKVVDARPIIDTIEAASPHEGLVVLGVVEYSFMQPFCRGARTMYEFEHCRSESYPTIGSTGLDIRKPRERPIVFLPLSFRNDKQVSKALDAGLCEAPWVGGPFFLVVGRSGTDVKVASLLPLHECRVVQTEPDMSLFECRVLDGACEGLSSGHSVDADGHRIHEVDFRLESHGRDPFSEDRRTSVSSHG